MGIIARKLRALPVTAAVLLLSALSAGSWAQYVEAPPPPQKALEEKLVKFIPDGYRYFEESRGDLNGDGVDDCVLIVKATRADKIYGNGIFDDENRRGIIILFKDGDGYKVALQNLQCFSNGEVKCGACNLPDISFPIKKGNLYIRYYYWGRHPGDGNAELIYTFRYRDSEFELIGYDHDLYNEKKSINILGKKMMTKEKKKGAKEVWSEIAPPKPILLKNIYYMDRFDIDIALGIKSPFGTIADARDGKTYKTAIMPNGVRWMAENLNYLPKGGKSWCYGKKLDNCKTYGRLYDAATAAKACPSGFRAPSYDDWNDLAASIAGGGPGERDGSPLWKGVGKKLKAKSGWDKDWGGNGTDDFGFSALPGGERGSEHSIKMGDTDEFMSIRRQGVFWAVGDGGCGECEGVAPVFIVDDDDARLSTMSRDDAGFSLRCISDY